MRNLLQYPITSSEIEDLLRLLSKEAAFEKRIGDMRPLLLKSAADIVNRAAFTMHEVVITGAKNERR